jgi:PKD repeat protein
MMHTYGTFIITHESFMTQFPYGRSAARASFVAFSALLLVAFSVIVISEPQQTSAQGPPGDESLACDLDIALVLDRSSSIDSDELAQMRESFKGFVDKTLTGTGGGANMMLISFARTAQVRRSWTGNANAMKNAIDDIASPSDKSQTNWQDAIELARSQFPHRDTPDNPDVIIMASDGNANALEYEEEPLEGVDNPDASDYPELFNFDGELFWVSETTAMDAAIDEAELAKDDDIYIKPIGIGDNLAIDNLRNISSSDDYVNSDFTQLTTDLESVAQNLCADVFEKPDVDIDADAESGMAPVDVELSWNTGNEPDACIANGDWSGSKNATGGTEEILNLDGGFYTYTLSCGNPGGTTTDSVSVDVPDRTKPSISMSADPQSGPEQLDTVIEWSVSDFPQSCTASGDWGGSKSINGGTQQFTGLTQGTYTYELTCSNSLGSVTESVDVVVNTVEPNLTLSVDNGVGTEPHDIVLDWDTSYYPDSCTASGDWSGSKDTSGGQQLIEDLSVGSYSYTLTCSNDAGDIQKNVSVQVYEPVTVSLNADPSTVIIPPNGFPSSGSSDLTWDSSGGADSCSGWLEGMYSPQWNGAKSSSGSETLSYDRGDWNVYRYWIQCENTQTGSEDYASAEVDVRTGIPDMQYGGTAPSVDFSAEPEVGPAPLSTDLTWSTSGESWNCEASGGTATWNGQVDASGGTRTISDLPLGDHTFTLKCGNPFGTTTNSVTVNAIDPPSVDVSASPDNGAAPLDTTISWSTTNSPASCTASGDWGGSKSATGGSQAFERLGEGTYTYTLECSKDGYSVQDSATVEVTYEDPYCGDGVINGDEECDGGNLDGATCQSLGYKDTDDLRCDMSGDDRCTLDASQCVVPLEVTLDSDPATVIIPPSGFPSVGYSDLTWTTSGNPSSCYGWRTDGYSWQWRGSKAVSGGTDEIRYDRGEWGVYEYRIWCTKSGDDVYGYTEVDVRTGIPGMQYGGSAPSVSFSADPSSGEAPVDTELTWTAGDSAGTCIASGGTAGWGGEVSTNGGTQTITGLSEGDYTFTLKCGNPFGTTTKQATVSSVVPPSVSIDATPTSGDAPLDTTLQWTTSNGPTSCTASGDWSGSKSATGGSETFERLDPGTYTFAIECDKQGFTGTDQVTVDVAYGGPYCGDGSVNNGEECEGSDLDGESCKSLGFDWGTLSCNMGGSNRCTFDTSGCVDIADPDVSISASPTSGDAPLNTQLTWTTTNNPESCTASGDWSGSKDVDGGNQELKWLDPGTYTFEIECDKQRLSVSDSVTVEVDYAGPYCGDNSLNSSEECDGSLHDGETCQSLGYDRGSLSCNMGETNRCTFDTTDCEDCADNWQQTCKSDPNTCGLQGTGQYNCDGVCSATMIDDSQCPDITLSVPRNVRQGAVVNVEWQAEEVLPNSCEVTGSNGDGPWLGNSGSEESSPLTSTTVYEIECQSDVGDQIVTESAAVYVGDIQEQ